MQRLGYETVFLDRVLVEPDSMLEILLRVSAIQLDSVIIRIGREPGREGFERRRGLGPGFFLDPREVGETETRGGPGELLRKAPGFNMGYTAPGWARPWSYRGSGCVITYIDYTRFRERFAGGAIRNLHEELYHRDVVGLEPYPEYSDVPPDLQPLAHPSDSPRRCGLVIYWTQNGW